MLCPALPTEGSSQIQCGWTGCGVQLAYDEGVISNHINKIHKERSHVAICQWESPGGGVCGKSMHGNHLRRHVLDIHTTLIVAWCERCGEQQRKDVMSRHKKTCEQRK